MAEFSVAFTRTDITPGPNTARNRWMAGYGWDPRGNPNFTTARPLRAECVMIRQTTGDPLIAVRVDLLNLPTYMSRRIRARVVNELRLTGNASFMLQSSHTHSGPALPEEPDPYIIYGLSGAQLDEVNEYADWLIRRIVALVRETVAKAPTPVTLSYGEGVARAAVNRVGLGWSPDEVPVLLARREGTNASFLALYGYACHPVARGSEPVFDSDFPGVAGKLIETQLGCPAFFFNGAAGDRNPDRMGSDADVVNVGTRVGEGAVKIVRDGGLTPVRGPVKAILRAARLPLAEDLTNPDVLLRLDAAYEQERLRAVQEGDVPGARFCESMRRELADGSTPVVYNVPVQCWKFGSDFGILGLGGEALSGYNVGTRAATNRRLWVMAYANEIPGYVPADDVLWHWPGPACYYESGWDENPKFSGRGTSMMAFGWPVPLASSQPVGTSPATPQSAEGVLMATCRRVLAD
ncbi:hypothetical protein GCM10022247_15200 [Allokutzneria multivorans]|uniref:Ceramidase n=1 Tax=Allokutzneria multivorans TaxID=1142134 RepID=A0ABP7RE91_9PSEU